MRNFAYRIASSPHFLLPNLLPLSFHHTSHSKSSSSPSSSSYFLYSPLSPDKTPKDSIEFNTKYPMRERMEACILRVQKEICDAIEEIDGKKFRVDRWNREHHGGGGITCVLQEGNVFEKAGVGISIVHGILPPQAVTQMKHKHNIQENKSLPFYACGISLVIHPHNPMAPTLHLNYRYFEVENGVDENGKPQIESWFGGGADLTPSYLFEEDARHFHAVYKLRLDAFDKDLYPEMKKACDSYFYIPHRKERRGVGGIFFDDMKNDSEDKAFQIVRACANAMVDSYLPILSKRISMPFTEEQKRWQQIRRGRYVEFNIMYDRGTKFGLHTPAARIESILMSLPLTSRWEYMHEPVKGSWEEKTLQVLQEPVDWVTLSHVSTKSLLDELVSRGSDSGTENTGR